MRPDELARLADDLTAPDAPVTVTATMATDPGAPATVAVRVRQAGRAAIGALPHVADRFPLDADAHARLVARLEGLADEADRQVGGTPVGAGLACYVTPDVTRVVRLEHAPPDRVIVADAFSLAVPILDVTHDVDVDVIVLSSGGGSTQGARLYRLEGRTLTEHVDDVLPLSHDREDDDPRDSGEGRPDAAARDAGIANFLRDLDRHLATVLGRDHGREVVVVGIERLRHHFAAVRDSALTARILTEVDGNVDRIGDAALATLVRDAVVAARRERALAAVRELAELPPARTATAPDDVHALAAAGRIHRLLVEEGATEELEVDGVVVGDRIARTIRACWDSGATVTVVPAGSLAVSGGLAAVTRW